MQLKLGDQILAEDKHQPLFKVRSFRYLRLLHLCGLIPAAKAASRLRPQAENVVQELSDRPETAYVPGGATQNSIRVAQWMLQVADATSYFGCVGSDDFADIMRQTARKDGVNVSKFYSS